MSAGLFISSQAFHFQVKISLRVRLQLFFSIKVQCKPINVSKVQFTNDYKIKMIGLCYQSVDVNKMPGPKLITLSGCWDLDVRFYKFDG